MGGWGVLEEGGCMALERGGDACWAGMLGREADLRKYFVFVDWTVVTCPIWRQFLCFTSLLMTTGIIYK